MQLLLMCLFTYEVILPDKLTPHYQPIKGIPTKQAGFENFFISQAEFQYIGIATNY
jgi:hypothetical protein